MRVTASRLALGLVLATAIPACGGPDTSSADQASTAIAAASGATFTGNLIVSATTVGVGTPFTVTETATNLTASQVGPIIVGIRRLGFTVLAAQKPRTGICRIAGSATCNFLELAPYETQSYTLTLVGNTPGTYQIQGWTTSSYVSGGFSGSVTVTVQ
jgi:hypothetical protein